MLTTDMLKPTERFTNRVDNYTKYRPGYPAAIGNLLRDAFQLKPNAVIADIGSGTGIFAELLLQCGYTVYCVEPNTAMQSEAERRLGKYPGFKSIAGRAEATTLPDNCVDLITAAQAFHWFEPMAANTEFKRILQPKGGIALLWNLRVNDAPQMKAYEQLKMDFGTDYLLTKRADEERIRAFFKDDALTIHTVPNNQLLDFIALKGQLLSASYIPLAGHPTHPAMLLAIEDIFNRYNKNGLMEIVQQTKVYINR